MKIAARLQVDPGHCVFIGDSDVDMQTGKAVQMLSVGVLWGFRDEEELRWNGADRLALAVTEANASARALYAGLGFRKAGEYHYRRSPEPI